MSVNMEEWVRKVKGIPIPVLAHSVDMLDTLCASENTTIQKIVDVVEQDPGLTVQLLRTCNGSSGDRLQREITSVQQAAMMIGTRPLAEMSKTLPTLKKSLQEPAHTQILRTFCRAYHAGIQAVEWARIRRDMTPDEVFAATQLHFLGEMVLALHAPEKLLEAFTLRREKNIASEEAQYICLGFTLDQLSLAIAQEWHLPQLVIEALQAENANHPRGHSIMLAVQLARSAAIDWYSDKMSAIYKQAAELLEMEFDDVCRQSHILAVEVARQTNYYGVMQSASLLPQIRSRTEQKQIKQTISKDYQADICLTPQVNVLRDTLEKLKQAIQEKQSRESMIQICIQGMHDGIGLNRVVFAVTDDENKSLQVKLVMGADNDPVFNRFKINLDKPHLFLKLIEKPQAVCINDNNRQKFWPLVPVEFKKLIGTNSFMAMSVFSGDELLGLIYADRHTSACQLDDKSYNYFKSLCDTLSKAISQSQQ